MLNILPVELILDIVQRLNPPDIRRMTKVSHESAYIVASSKVHAQMSRCNCSDDHKLQLAIYDDNMNWVMYYLGRVDLDDETIDNYMIAAACYNREEMRDMFVQMGGIDWFSGLVEAAKEGKLKAISYFIDMGAENVLEALEVAVENQQLKAFDFLLDIMVTRLGMQLDESDLNEFLWTAAGQGNIEMIKRMIELGADDIEEALFCAVIDEQEESIKCLISIGAGDWNAGLLRAVTDGTVAEVKFYLKHGANNLNEALHAHIQIDPNSRVVHNLVSAGADDVNTIMMAGIHIEDMYLINMAVSQGFAAWDHALTHAIWIECDFFIEYLLFKGATILGAPLITAAEIGSLSIVRMLFEHGRDSLEMDTVNEAIARAKTQEIIDYLEIEIGQKAPPLPSDGSDSSE